LPGECDEGSPVADGTICDDGDAQTIDDQCFGGICEGIQTATCPCFNYQDAVHAVEGMNGSVNTPNTPKECNKAVDVFPDGSIIFSERYFNWQPGPGLHGTALHAVVSNDRTLCRLWDAEGKWPPVEVLEYDGWDRMLSCISIIEEAVQNNANQDVLDFCDW
jgi:hypothetical protein